MVKAQDIHPADVFEVALFRQPAEVDDRVHARHQLIDLARIREVGLE